MSLIYFVTISIFRRALPAVAGFFLSKPPVIINRSCIEKMGGSRKRKIWKIHKN